MTDVIECAPDVGIQNPRVSPFAQAEVALSDGIVAASAGTKAEAVGFEPRFPVWLDRVLNNCLSDAVRDSRNSQRSEFSTRLRDINSSGWFDLPERISQHLVNQSHALVRSKSPPAINASSALAPILLSGSSNRQQQVGETA